MHFRNSLWQNARHAAAFVYLGLQVPLRSVDAKAIQRPTTCIHMLTSGGYNKTAPWHSHDTMPDDATCPDRPTINWRTQNLAHGDTCTYVHDMIHDIILLWLHVDPLYAFIKRPIRLKLHNMAAVCMNLNMLQAFARNHWQPEYHNHSKNIIIGYTRSEYKCYVVLTRVPSISLDRYQTARRVLEHKSFTHERDHSHLAPKAYVMQTVIYSKFYPL